DWAHVVIHLDRYDVADGPAMNPLDRLALGEIIAVAKTRCETDILLLRDFRGLDDGTNSGSINGDWLFIKDVFAFLHRFARVLRPEMRRSRQDYHVADINHAFIRVKTNKQTVRQIDSIAEFLLKLGNLVVDVVSEGVANRIQLDVRVGLQCFEGC